MSTLFSLAPSFPEGFIYIPDFITEKEESDWISEIKSRELKPFVFRGYEAKRKVASFGQDWSFEKGILRLGKEIPEAFRPLIKKVALFAEVNENDFEELLLTEYPEGSVINWHRDAPPFELLAGVSLLADCTFRLRPYQNKERGKGAVLSFPVTRRSLYLMSGPARWDWEHSIDPLPHLRYSITLRTLKNRYRKNNLAGKCN